MDFVGCWNFYSLINRPYISLGGELGEAQGSAPKPKLELDIYNYLLNSTTYKLGECLVSSRHNVTLEADTDRQTDRHKLFNDSSAKHLIAFATSMRIDTFTIDLVISALIVVGA